MITTGETEVRRELIKLMPAIMVIDCTNGWKDVKTILEECLKSGVNILLTYRCPYIIPKEIYNKVLSGAYNIHPSLLPSYPGLNPWDGIFRDQLRRSGVTLHRLSEKPDSGEIIAQESFDITPEDTLMSAREKADEKARNLLKFII